MGKPRIYIAVTNFYPSVGGIQRQALVLSRSLCQRGNEVTIVTYRRDKTWSVNEVVEGVSIIRVAGSLLVDREKLPRVFQKITYLLAIIAMSWTLWWHRQHYDILHVYQLNLLALLSAFVCMITGKPMIVAVRCTDAFTQDNTSPPVNPLNVSTSYLRIEGQNQDYGDLEELERIGKPIVFCTYTLLKHIRAVVIILSSRMKLYLTEHNFLLPEMHLIPNGVDIKRFSPQIEVSSTHERNQIVVCVSRLCYQKGIDVLLHAWRLVLSESPEARLIIVGDGPLQSQLKRMSLELHVADSIEFAGMQSDVLAQFHRGSFAVLPSRWEGMPNALLEAMACGLPCVATRVSGSEDIIEHGVNGLLVEPEDYENMAKALVMLLHDPLLASTYGRAARATIEQQYSVEQITNMYMELYQRIADYSSQKEDQRAHLPI